MVARVIIGLAGAGLIVMALLRAHGPLQQRGTAKSSRGHLGATFVAFPIGPIFGGWLLSNFWWGWVFLINVPIVVVALAAVVRLVPESRASKRPRTSIWSGWRPRLAGLVILTYGLIKAGQDGWSDLYAFAMMVWGVSLLVGFFILGALAEPAVRVVSRCSTCHLFSSPSFTWGVVLAMLPILAMLGILFTMPQYFQGVLGANAMGSGLRLLPLVAGLMVGALPAARVVQLVGAPRLPWRLASPSSPSGSSWGPR
jgi:DHA2 family multidrug resistance protein-like MFS transporter